MKKSEIFISYYPGGESEKIVNELDKAFQEKDILLVRDKRDLGFKSLITDFMKRLGAGKAVVVVISDDYLRTPYCMYELFEIYRNLSFRERIFPVVLRDANISDPIHRLKYLKYWQDKKKELDEAMAQIGNDAITVVGDDYITYKKIFDNFGEVVNILKDINALTPETHREENFKSLIEAVTKDIKQNNNHSLAEIHTPKTQKMDIKLNLKRIEKYLEQFDYTDIQRLFNYEKLSIHKDKLRMMSVGEMRQSAIDVFDLNFRTDERVVTLLKLLWDFANDKDKEFGDKAEYVILKDAAGMKYVAESNRIASDGRMDNAQVNKALTEILKKLNKLENQNETILEKVEETYKEVNAMLPKVDGITDRIAAFARNYPPEVNNEIIHLLKQIQQNQIPETELLEIFSTIGAEIDKLKNNELKSIWDKLNKPEIPIISKFEFAITIIPGFLSYKPDINKIGKQVEKLAKLSRKLIF